MADDEIKKHGAVTEYRPNDDRARGGKTHSVQTEALGADGSENLSNTSASSGGAAGRINDLDHNPTPKRDGGENKKTGPASDATR
jgi:hypothetical protein